MIDPTVFTTEKADIRVEIAGRWTKGMTVCNFEKMGGMRHFGGTASEQIELPPHRGDEARPSEILRPDRRRAAASHQSGGVIRLCSMASWHPLGDISRISFQVRNGLCQLQTVETCLTAHAFVILGS